MNYINFKNNLQYERIILQSSVWSVDQSARENVKKYRLFLNYFCTARTRKEVKGTVSPD